MSAFSAVSFSKRNLLSLMMVVVFLAFLPVSHVQADSAKVTDFVNKLGNDALAVVSDSSASSEQKLTKLQQMFISVVDIDWIAKFVLGKYNKQITPEQREKYNASYRDFLIKHYTSNFEEYKDGTTFKVTGTVEDKPDEYVSSMEITRPGAKPLVVDYRVREKDGSLKVMDIVVEGVSLIITQRSEFSSVIARDGIDGLIKLLEEKKNQQVSSN